MKGWKRGGKWRKGRREGRNGDYGSCLEREGKKEGKGCEGGREGGGREGTLPVGHQKERGCSKMAYIWIEEQQGGFLCQKREGWVLYVFS